MNDLIQVEPKYIYITIPAEYVCVYHRILAMLADYGVEMLKDCKATCKDRNSGVIECFNMFNAAVAARTLSAGDEDSSYYKLSETLIKYIKSKINQIYKGKDNSTSFVFPIDETGELKAFVSCGELPKFWIKPEDGELYEHKFYNGFDEHFQLGPEDTSEGMEQQGNPRYVPNPTRSPLSGHITARYEKQNGKWVACADVIVKFRGKAISLNNTNYQYYFDDEPVARFNDVQNISYGNHKFSCVINYNGYTIIFEDEAWYEG